MKPKLSRFFLFAVLHLIPSKTLFDGNKKAVHGGVENAQTGVKGSDRTSVNYT